MWKWLGGKTRKATVPSDVDRARAAVGAFLEGRGEAAVALERLQESVVRVWREADGYPARPIRADVWIDGAACATMGHALTRRLRADGALEDETAASALWAQATLAVCSHYRHLVGPAMVAHADCHERRGDPERAADLYRAVVRDFADLADGGEGGGAGDEDGGAGDEDGRTAREALATAVDRLRALGVPTVDDIDLAELAARAARALGR